jgi:hypothetical protein
VNADKEHKDIVRDVKANPKHQKEKAQIQAVSGIGVTGVLGSVGLDAIDFLGNNVAEIIGGGTGVSIVLFFIVKFFITEMDEMSNV